MKNRKSKLLTALILPAILLVTGPAVSGVISNSGNDDLFLESVYEDYTLENVNTEKTLQRSSDFAGLETGSTVSDADIFLEREYEDYTISQ